MDILRCILKIYPDWKGVVWENDYKQIKPHELEKRPIPTIEQLEAVWSEVQKDIALEECFRNRMEEYLPGSETLDALSKMHSSDTVVQEAGRRQMAEIAARNMSVKAKYPKPI